jgi:uncharacterized membrane protein
MTMHARAAAPLGKLGVALLALLSLPIALYAFSFYFVDAVGDPSFKTRFATLPVFAAFHVLGAGVALLIGPFQFIGAIRARALNVHRWLGRTYVSAVLIGGTGGFMLATIATGGLVARVGFALLAVIWLYTGAQAYFAVRRRDLEVHRRWMIRNFSLTFAAVTLRVHLPIMQVLGIPFEEAYPVVAWLAWVPNLLIAEWFVLARKTHRIQDEGAALNRASQRSSAFAND